MSIERLVRAAVTDGTLVLESSQLEGEPAAEILDACFAAGRMVILDAQVGDTASGCTVDGLGALLGVENSHLHVEFFEQAEGTHVRLDAHTLPLGWRLSTSFPGMEGSFADALTYRHPRLSIDSRSPDRLPADFQVELGHEPTTVSQGAHVLRGVELQAEIDLAVWNAAAWLINGERITVEGPVEVVDGVARMWLKSELQGPSRLGGFSFPFELQLVSFPSSADRVAVSYARVCCDLALEVGGAPLALPVAARLEALEQASLTLEVDSSSLSSVALAELSQLFEGRDLGPLLPATLPGLDRLLVRSVQILLSLEETRVAGVLVDVEVVGEWRFWNLNLSDLRLRLRLWQGPFAASSTLSVALFATSQLGGAAIASYVELPGLDFRVSLLPGTKMALADLAGFLGLDSLALPEVECVRLALDGNPQTGGWTLRSDVEAQLALDAGVAGLALTDMVVLLQSPGGDAASTTGVLSGTLELAGRSLRADWRLPGGLVLMGELGSVGLGAVIDELAGTGVRAGLGFPDQLLEIDIEDVRFVFDAAQGSVTLGGSTGSLGQLELSVQRAEGSWGFGLGVRPREGFTLSDLASELAFLDGVELGSAYLLLSSFAYRELSLPNQPHQSVERVERGVNFYLPLRLGGFPGVSFLEGVVDLDVDVALRGAFSTSRELLLEAALAGFEITKGVEFQTVGFRVRTSVGDVALSLFGTLLVTLEDELTFTGEVTAEPTGAYLSATMEGTWEEPFGIKGFTLSDVALQVGWAASGLPAVGVAGTAVVGGFAGSFAVLLNSVDPIESVLQLAFDELTTEVLFDELMAPQVRRAVPAELRELLAYGYRDVDIHLVPETTRIGQVDYQQGFRLAGKTALLGVQGKIDARLDYLTGLEAEGRVDRIRLARIPGGPYLFALTAADDARRGPAFEVDFTTTGTPSLSLSGRVAMLGFFEDLVLAEGGARGLRFRLERQVGPTEARLDCTLGDDGLAGSGRLRFDLDFSTSVKIPGTDTKLGRVVVKSRLVGRAEIEVGPDAFVARVTGSFEWRGQSLSIPEIEIRTTPRDMEHLLRLVVEGIEDSADDLFADLLGSLEDLMQAMGEGVVAVGRAIGQTAEEAGAAIANAYGATAEQAAEFFSETDFSPAEVGGAMKSGFVASADEAAKILEGAGYASRAVGRALKGNFTTSANTVARALKGAGFSSSSTAKALKGTFTNSTEAAAKALKRAGFSTSKVGSALKGTFSNSHDTVGKALKAAGCSAKDSAKVLKTTFDKGAKNVARHFKREWNKGDNGVKNLLKDSGFSKNNVKGAMEDIFNWGPAKFVTGWF